MTDNCHDTLVKLRVMNCRRSYTKLHSCMSFCIKNPRISVPKSAETAANRWSEPIRPIYGWTEHDLNLKSRPLPCGIGVVAGSCRGSKLGTINSIRIQISRVVLIRRHLSSSRASSTVHVPCWWHRMRTSPARVPRTQPPTGPCTREFEFKFSRNPADQLSNLSLDSEPGCA